MSFIHLSYLRAFSNYANSLLTKFTDFQQIGEYARLLTEKAKELLTRAALNTRINLTRLHKQMFELGKTHVQVFSEKFSKIKHERTEEGAREEKMIR